MSEIAELKEEIRKLREEIAMLRLQPAVVYHYYQQPVLQPSSPYWPGYPYVTCQTNAMGGLCQ